MPEDGRPIAYTALGKGVPVVSQSGNRFGTVERVLDIPAEDVFRGLVVSTRCGLRFVDRDLVEQITTTRVVCSLSDEQAAALPRAPRGAPDATGGDRPVRALRIGPRFTGPVSIVRCSRGGLFETVWIPLGSFKAIRLGVFRIQRCPVHARFEVVRRVDPDTLTNEERAAAARYPADPIP
jgi:hypothetical protein